MAAQHACEGPHHRELRLAKSSCGQTDGRFLTGALRPRGGQYWCCPVLGRHRKAGGGTGENRPDGHSGSLNTAHIPQSLKEDCGQEQQASVGDPSQPALPAPCLSPCQHFPRPSATPQGLATRCHVCHLSASPASHPLQPDTFFPWFQSFPLLVSSELSSCTQFPLKLWRQRALRGSTARPAGCPAHSQRAEGPGACSRGALWASAPPPPAPWGLTLLQP